MVSNAFGCITHRIRLTFLYAFVNSRPGAGDLWTAFEVLLRAYNAGSPVLNFFGPSWAFKVRCESQLDSSKLLHPLPPHQFILLVS